MGVTRPSEPELLLGGNLYRFNMAEGRKVAAQIAGPMVESGYGTPFPSRRRRAGDSWLTGERAEPAQADPPLLAKEVG